jgi:hypothetical protein
MHSAGNGGTACASSHDHCTDHFMVRESRVEFRVISLTR